MGGKLDQGHRATLEVLSCTRRYNVNLLIGATQRVPEKKRPVARDQPWSPVDYRFWYSMTVTSWPRRWSASAAVRLAMPAPSTRTFLGEVVKSDGLDWARGVEANTADAIHLLAVLPDDQQRAGAAIGLVLEDHPGADPGVSRSSHQSRGAHPLALAGGAEGRARGQAPQLVAE